jgi:internalin A
MQEKELKELIAKAKTEQWTQLYFSNKTITKIPEEIGDLTSLQYLDLSNNQIAEVSGVISRLISLRAIYLSNNQITKIPEEIGDLTSLQYLNLSNNQIAEVSGVISRRTSLRAFDLSDNQITEISEVISKLTSLQNLNLSNNQIIEIPEAIGKLTSLQNLNLSNNQIIEIPEAIGKLAFLQNLNLSNNQIAEISGVIGKLTSLQNLNLSNNQIAEISGVIGKLTSLQSLNLLNNQIIEIPEAIGKLISLQSIYLSNNQIIEIPEAIGKLISLQSIYLSNNQIIEIPETIGKLISLQFLDLSENEITEIPVFIEKIVRLKQFILQGNPINNLPAEIIRQGWGEYHWDDGNLQAIFNYLKEQRAGDRPLQEAKMILVGFGGVGKTSLIKRLVHNDFDKDEPQTHEVQITKWPVTLNTQSAENITVHTWDFGGQQVMHSTHQFFLTERSLYLLVLNGRQGQEDEDAEYWLELIKSFGKDSPVIIVLNKFNATRFDVNRSDLRQKFPNIIEFVQTDCQDSTGIDDLQRTVIRELDKLEGLRDSFPAKWFQIKDRLAAMTENYIDFETYREICRSHGEADPHKQERLAFYLHLLGIALNYNEDDRLKDTNILNPHWVTKGVYRIITSGSLQQNQGKLDRAHLRQILDSQEYPSTCYDFLLCLMRKFELCFPFPEAVDSYLVPNLLSKQQPPIADEFQPIYSLNFRYSYPVLPEGLLPRFVVRTHHLNKTQAWWRSGTILDFEGSRALVKADRVSKNISIAVIDGNEASRSRLLAIIRSNFEDIHSNFKFIVNEWVPLPEHPEKQHLYQDLLTQEQAGIAEVTDVVNGKIIQTSIKQLLNGVDLPEQRNRNIDKNPLVKIFYSYSHKDEALRDELETHLTLMKRQGLIASWNDRCILAGQEFAQEIDTHLQSADIILLLVSSDFIASNYCYEIEMKTALAKHQKNEAVMIPIIIRSVDWKSSLFGTLNVLPTDGIAVKMWGDRDSAWTNVSEGIKKVVQEIHFRNTKKKP